MILLKTAALQQHKPHPRNWNGCGNSLLSCVIARVAQWAVKVEFKPACDMHDAEWSISLKYKTVEHWRESNANLLYNCMLLCGKPEVTVRYRMKLRLAVLFYSAVMLNTYNDYLRN